MGKAWKFFCLSAATAAAEAALEEGTTGAEDCVGAGASAAPEVDVSPLGVDSGSAGAAAAVSSATGAAAAGDGSTSIVVFVKVLTWLCRSECINRPECSAPKNVIVGESKNRSIGLSAPFTSEDAVLRAATIYQNE